MTFEDTKIIHARLVELRKAARSIPGAEFASLTMIDSEYGLHPVEWSARVNMFPATIDGRQVREPDVKGCGPCPLSAIEAAFAELKRRTEAMEAA